LEQALPQIRSAGLGVAAVSYDSVAVLKQFSGRAGITFPLLSDPHSAVIRSYGILNETIDKDTPFYGIPYPGTYILNPAGVVLSKYFEDDYRVRDTAASILLRQFGLEPKQHETTAARHLAITTASSDLEVRPGQRITLTVSAKPGPRIHVYAPGVRGYIPIALTLDPSKGFTADPVAYPASKTLNLRAIHETLPVYDTPFRMLVTMTLANAAAVEPLLDAGRNLRIEGKFRYQACDDRECFIPETLPLVWTIHVLPFDRQRVPEDIRRRD
jgi:hypothetical protein